MALFSKVKQFLGMDTLKVKLTVPPQVQKAAGQITGNVTVTAITNQHMLDLSVKLIESWHTGHGAERTEKEFELGKVTLAQDFKFATVNGCTQLSDDFVLPFDLVKSNAERLKEMGGALGMLGKASAVANGEKSTFKVIAVADVKGAAFDPSDEKTISLI